MEFMEVVRKRRSIRRYKPNPVPAELIRQMLEAGRLAPSWANTQCWHFVVVTDEEVRMKIGEAGMRFVGRAPVIIVVCADPEKPGYKGDIPNYLVDVGIVMDHMILAATDLGLGTCWIGGFHEHVVKDALGVPENMRVVAMTPLGYADQEPEARPRKALTEIVSYDRYAQ
ncbi:MAG: nitroreductase family protein [Dehalococcoidia bacterium]|nr:nitroreductase family protein [Dehalococcoidia bacterium]